MRTPYHGPGAFFPPLPGEAVARSSSRRVRKGPASLESFFGTGATPVGAPPRRSGRFRLV